VFSVNCKDFRIYFLNFKPSQCGTFSVEGTGTSNVLKLYISHKNPPLNYTIILTYNNPKSQTKNDPTKQQLCVVVVLFERLESKLI